MTPVSKNIVANFYQLFVIFVNQILLVPAYLMFMDINVYVDWLVLTALASFFSMSDLGLSDASNNLFCIKYSAGEKKLCEVILTNNMLFVVGIAFIVLLLFIVGGNLLDTASLLGLNAISGEEAMGIVMVMLVQIFTIMSGCVFDAIFKATHRAHVATYLNYSARLISAVMIFVGLVTDCPLVVMAALGAAPYVGCLIYKAIAARRWFFCSFNIDDFSFSFIKSLLNPTAGFAMLLIGNAVLVQCYTLVINAAFGALVLVQFTTMRTMMNFVRQVGIAITAGIKPEFSLTYGRGDYDGMRWLYRKSLIYCTIGGATAVIVLLLAGQPIYEIWTRGEVPFSYTLFFLFAAIQPITLIWEACSVALTATNRHFGLGALYITSCVTAVLMAAFLAWCGLSVQWVLATMFLIDIVMVFYAIGASQRVIRKSTINCNVPHCSIAAK